MSGTAANIVSGQGILYSAAYGEALPELNNLAPPLITVTPGGTWADFGYTIDDHSWAYEPTYEDEEVNEVNMALDLILVKEEMFFRAMFKERTMALWNKLIAASSLSTVSAAADQTGQSNLTIGNGTPVNRALLYVHRNQSSGSRLFHMPRTKPVKVGEITFKKGNTKGYAVDFKVQYDATAGYAMKGFDLLTAATS